MDVAALAVREGLSRKKASFGYFLDEHEHPRISRADEHFEDKGMQFIWGMEELSIDDLNTLFVRVIIIAQTEQNIAPAYAGLPSSGPHVHAEGRANWPT